VTACIDPENAPVPVDRISQDAGIYQDLGVNVPIAMSVNILQAYLCLARTTHTEENEAALVRTPIT
jgi:hypothetical protein